MSGQHSSWPVGAQPSKGELPASGRLGEYLKSTHDGTAAPPGTHSGGICLYPQTAAPPTTQPRPWRPWVASSTPWHNTPRQTEGCGKPHWHHRRPLAQVAPRLPPQEDETHAFHPSCLTSWVTAGKAAAESTAPTLSPRAQGWGGWGGRAWQQANKLRVQLSRELSLVSQPLGQLLGPCSASSTPLNTNSKETRKPES